MSAQTARAAAAAILWLALAAGCDDDDEPAGPSSQPEASTAPDGDTTTPLPAQDAGTRAGDGADPRRVRVPESDATPPTGTIALVLAGGRIAAEASRPGKAPREPVALERPRLHATMVGIDRESGAVRVRVSVKEAISCRSSTGETEVRSKLRHFPPSQIERVSAATGPGSRPARAARARSCSGAGAAPPARLRRP
jgi:hypothetical protein